MKRRMRSQANEKNKNKIKFSIQNTLVDETKVGIQLRKCHLRQEPTIWQNEP
jgi:hypothetical protein